MKSSLRLSFSRNRGSAVVSVLILIVVTMIVMSATLSWTFTNVRLNHRHNQYTRCLAAAEAATEKAIVSINTDYKNFGQGYVERNIDRYRTLIPKASEHPGWSEFRFVDKHGNIERMDVEFIKGTSLVPVSKNYKGLLGFPSTFRVASTVSEFNTPIKANGAVLQEVQVSLIPIFQFASFYNMDYECNALPKMEITGPVHVNGSIYLNPVTSLTYHNDVTCTGKIIRGPKSGSGMATQSGSVTYKGAHDGGVSNLTLPIGTNNTLTAVRQVIEKPSLLESPDSSIGQQRLYNKADMIITVTEVLSLPPLPPVINLTVTSGLADGFKTVVPYNQATQFINTAVTFTNQREKRTVKCTQIDIARFKLWNETNDILRPVLPMKDVRVIYISEERLLSLTTHQPGVRLVNGQTLPASGLTIATPVPVYILGHYNCPNAAHLGTFNTSMTAPAAIIADAVTVLSGAFADSKSANAYTTRIPTATTVNAAIVAGIVQSVSGKGYSGGIENFPRFLEDWDSPAQTFTYNGSMVVMFESKYAISPWQNIGVYYDPPVRNWAFDQNFRFPDKLPPATPTAYVLTRGEWNVIAPGKYVAAH